MAKTTTDILKIGEEPPPVTLINGEEYSATFENPNGALVRCQVVSGKGQFTLWKNDRWVGNTYTLSTEPGSPTTVDLRTLTAAEERALLEDPSQDIPASSWGIYVKALGPEKESEFTFKLVS